jgi:hypothetical protein
MSSVAPVTSFVPDECSSPLPLKRYKAVESVALAAIGGEDDTALASGGHFSQSAYTSRSTQDLSEVYGDIKNFEKQSAEVIGRALSFLKKEMKEENGRMFFQLREFFVNERWEIAFSNRSPDELLLGIQRCRELEAIRVPSDSKLKIGSPWCEMRDSYDQTIFLQDHKEGDTIHDRYLPYAMLYKARWESHPLGKSRPLSKIMQTYHLHTKESIAAVGSLASVSQVFCPEKQEFISTEKPRSEYSSFSTSSSELQGWLHFVTLCDSSESKEVEITLSSIISGQCLKGPESAGYLMVIHQHPNDLNKMLHLISKIFLDILKWKGEDDLSELKEMVVLFRYLFAHGMPQGRGSAAIGEWFESMFFQWHGYRISLKRPEMMDVRALIASSFEEFLEDYLEVMVLEEIRDAASS